MTETEWDKSLLDPPDQGYDKTKYTTICSISSVSSCTVKLALRKDKNRFCAIKKSTCSHEKKERLYFKREYNLLLKSKHPAIMKLYDCGYPVSNRTLKPFFEFEFALGGTLDNFIQVQQANQEKSIPSPYCEIILYGISSGLAYLHLQKYVHRDIKPSNILLDGNYEPMIGDFGFARKNFSDQIKSSFPNTINYASPEVINEEKSDEKSDVYSFGMTLYEIRTLQRPYSGLSHNLVYTKIMKGQKPTLPKTDPYYELFVQCTQANPAQRPSMSDVSNYIKSLASRNSIDGLSDFEEYCRRIDNNEEINSDDPNETLSKLTELASDGNPDALYYLGWLYFRGVLVDKDMLQSLELFRTASFSGHTNSKNALQQIFQTYQREIKSDQKLLKLADEIKKQLNF